jgi:hypothetical protein
MADYSAMKSQLGKNNLYYFTFSPNYEKPTKRVIQRLPTDTLEENISNSLEALGFNHINVKNMTATSHVEPLPIFLVTLTRNIQSQEIFKPNTLNYTAFKVELYRAQTGLTQCYSCQNFSHAWTSCREPPLCLWCGGGHLHRECPENTNTESTPGC